MKVNANFTVDDVFERTVELMDEALGVKPPPMD